MSAQIHEPSPPLPHPWLPRWSRIESIRPEAPGVWTFDFAGPAADQSAGPAEPVAGTTAFRPGQFNMLYLPGYGEAAISISSDPARRDYWSHTVRVVGNVTKALARQRVGDQVGVRGPFGSPWPIDDCLGCDVVIAGGGLGLAPLRPLIYHLVRHRDQFGRVALLYGARTPRDLLYPDEYDAWRAAGLDVRVTVDLGDHSWHGNIGVVPQLLDQVRWDAPCTRLFTCGPEIMMRFVIFAALNRRLPRDHIYLSMERNMSCAIGLCGHCQLGPTFVCKDGPVFTYARMEPFLSVEDF